MRRTTVGTAAGLAVLAITATGCKSGAHASTTTPSSTIVVATQTLADPTSAAPALASPSGAASAVGGSSPSGAGPPSVTPPPSSASNQPIDVCTLLPQGTVSGIVGHPIGAPMSSIGGTSPLSSSCRYGIADAIIIYTPDNPTYCQSLVSVIAGGEGYRLVPGVGDHASYSLYNGLLAFYGNTCIQTFNEYQIDRDFSLSADIALQQALRARL
jgi:hypothetical protein